MEGCFNSCTLQIKLLTSLIWIQFNLLKSCFMRLGCAEREGEMLEIRIKINKEKSPSFIHSLNHCIFYTCLLFIQLCLLYAGESPTPQDHHRYLCHRAYCKRGKENYCFTVWQPKFSERRSGLFSSSLHFRRS